MSTSGLILIHLRDFVRRPIDPADIYYLEADGDETLIRGRSSKLLRDVRSLGELSPAFENLPKPGFVRIHSNHTVNPHHIRELRHRAPAPNGRSNCSRSSTASFPSAGIEWMSC